MKLYNSATRKKEDFIPNHPDIVKMYTCGPTVYHFAHIGNLRSYIMEDILEKYPGSLVWVPASAGLLLCQHVVMMLTDDTVQR